MKKLAIIICLLFGIYSSASSQVSAVKYLIEYNDSTSLYDCKLVIIEGEATTYPQRIQFNSQYTIVTPTGATLTIEELHAPFENNATYTSTIPCLWELGPMEISPPTQPENDFHTVLPNLSPPSAYYDLFAGDTIKLFSLNIDVDPCENLIRPFESGLDPGSIEMPSGGDFSCGHTFGQSGQVYEGNLSTEYVNNFIAANDSTSICIGDCIELVPTLTCYSGPFKYEWSTGDTTEVIEVCPSTPTNYYLLLKDTFDDFLDSITVFVDFVPIIISVPIDTVCAGEIIILDGCANGTWSQDPGNPFGASLSPLPDGATEVTFDNSANSPYTFIYSLLGVSQEVTIMVIPKPDVGIDNNTICLGQTTQVSSLATGTWISNDPLIATVHPTSGLVTSINQGSVTFTFTVTSTGCTNTTGPLSISLNINVEILGADTICITGTTAFSPNTGGIWTSQNPAIAVSDNLANITGVGAGTAQFVFTEFGSGCQSLPIPITVEAEETELLGLSCVNIGETTSFSPTSNGTWVSSDPSVATIDNSGNVTGTGEGTVVFYFTNVTTGCKSEATETITVGESANLNIGDISLCIGETSQLFSNQDGTWSSDDPSIATVNPLTGLVSAVGSGSTGFTFTNTSGCNTNTSPLEINVIPNPEVQLLGPEAICIGQTTLLSPSTGGTWQSADNAILIINNLGVATGVSSGNASVVFYETSSGCVSDPVQIIVSTPLNPPEASSNSPICVGEDIQLSTDAVANATYQWFGPNGFTSNDQNPIINNVTSNEGGQYCVSVKLDGCSSIYDCTTVILDQEISSPIISTYGSSCEGEDLLLLIESVADATYQWTGPNGFTSTQNFVEIFGTDSADNGAYCVVVGLNGCESEPSCEDVQISPQLNAPNVSNNGPLCEGGDLELVAETIAGANYLWTGPNSFTSNLEDPVITGATPSNNGTYCVILVVNGCQSEADCTDVEVNPTPATPIASNNGPICEGEDIELTTSTVAGATYEWTGPNGFSSSDQNPIITNASINFNGQYCVEITINGCKSEQVCTDIEVKPIPATPVLTSNSPVCEIQHGINLFTDSIPGATYQWTGPNGFSFTSDFHDTYVDDNLITTDYTGTYCVVITVDGCSSMEGCTDVTVIPFPDTPLVTNNGPICEGEDLQLFAEEQPGTTYFWYDEIGDFSDQQNPTIIGATAEDSGLYCLIIESEHGCVTVMGCTEVIVNPKDLLPTIQVNTPICVGDDLELSTDELENGLYEWTGPNGFEAFIQNPVIPSVSSDYSGTYTLKALNSLSSCPNTELVTVEIEVINCFDPHAACDEIGPDDIICNFNDFAGVEGSLSSENSEGNQPSGFLCNSNDEVQNISWLGFVALEGDYDIVVNTTNCNLIDGSIGGVQIGLYSDCSFTAETEVFCENNYEHTNEVRIPSSILTPGQTYFLYIDGFEGSLCDYSIDIDGFYDNTYCTDLSKVTGVAYIDANENKIYDLGETLLRNALISLSPGNFSVLTNDEGKYIINTPKGGATLTAKMNEGHWINNELTIEDLTIFETCVEGINFGFVPNLFYQEANISVANTVTRCDWETRFYFTVENTGTIDLDARFEFEFDDKASYFSTNLIGLQVNGNVASGNLGVLEPFEIREYWVKLKMPSGSTVLPVLDFKTTLYNSEDTEMDAYEQSEQLRCSYDPNDKREYPNREGEENLTLMNEDLEYTIRFQNNGNDTAFQVKIIDPLDPYIDPSSIRVINSSHPVETCIENEILIFLFEDISLVDSMTNYEASQGFVSFRCSTKEGVPENTIVNNTADIIFDTNIPIVTNTTINTIVSKLCTNVNTEIDIKICEGDNYNGHEESGTYTEIFPLQYDCDSIVVINLDVQGITYSSQEIKICAGEPFDLNGETYELYESQEIFDTLLNQEGCISTIFIYNIGVNPVVLIEIDTIICEGLDYNGLTESGIYTIDSFDVNTGCDITTTINLEVLPLSDPACLVGINDLNEKDVKIYPNPVSNLLFIEAELLIEGVTIYSMSTQRIQEVEPISRENRLELSTQDLNQGLYIIAIKSGGKFVYKKLIVE